MNKEMIKPKRSLSGIFFRFKNPETNEIENRCFEDLPEYEQDRIIENQSQQWLRSLSKRLATVIVEIGELTQITKENEEEE